MNLGDAQGSITRRLTLREREVADYITRGRSNKYIAAELGVSQRTIEAHRARIFMKVGVRNAVELTQHYVRLKLPLSDDQGASPSPRPDVARHPWRPARAGSACGAVLGGLGS
ncbi:helix-turn-helix transcriptional regulator [uncultured Castellaniella sp.]|uniref:response regulator transcription factor n=1 Tax=uncultured Castellaniella sp. TaxID=647907 RepID=UPI002610442D|nr:helix-turn-helix transcriptional regulator [uncultured Castellaniella sp.]